MRKEPYTVGSYVHIVNRGHRKQPIVRDVNDRVRFLKMLRHFNDDFASINWYNELDCQNIYKRPHKWPPQRHLVKILGFCLMPNHFHLILKEIREGGVSKFMHKLGTGMSNSFNKKYEENGSLFQGSFRSKTITNEMHLRYAAIYVMIKNPFELYSGGLAQAIPEFDRAYSWTLDYQFGSLMDYFGSRESHIIDPEILGDLFEEEKDFKKFAKDCMEGRKLDFNVNEVKLR